MNSLADTYGNGSVGSDGSGRRQPLAIGLIVAGAILILIGAVMLFGSVGSGATPYLIAGVLGGLALPAVLVGIVAMLQTSPQLRVIAAIGGSLTILGVTLFWYAYPGQWGTFGNNPAGYAIVSYLLGMILIGGSILAGAMLRQEMRQSSRLGGSGTTHTGGTSASNSQRSQTYTTGNTSQAQQWNGEPQTVTTSDGGTVERQIKEVDTIGTSSPSSNSQSRSHSRRGSMSSSTKVDKITSSGQSQRETQKRQSDGSSQQLSPLSSPEQSASTTEGRQRDAVPDSRDRWVQKGKEDTTTFDQGADSANTNEQSGNTGSAFGSTAEVFGSSRQQPDTNTGPVTSKNTDTSQVGSSKDRARSETNTANSRETSDNSTTTESESTSGIDIIVGEDQTETAESTGSSPTGAAPTQTNSTPAQSDTDNTSTSRWSPDSPLGDPIPEDRKPDLADRYCGNCAYFGYGDSGVQPHCRYHNEDLSDMEACHDWQPNSKRN